MTLCPCTKASYYRPFAEALSAHVTVATADLRGHGHSSLRPSRKVDFGYKEMILEDLHNGLLAIQQAQPGKKIYLLGHSLGGQMGSLYASRHPGVLEGLVLVACCSVYYKGWQGLEGIKTLAGTQFAGVIASVLGYFPGKKVGFGGLEAMRMIQDWSRQSRTGDYILRNDPFNYEQALAKSRSRVLALSFQQDTWAPEKAVANLVNKFQSSPDVTHIHMQDDDPRNNNFNHFNWIKNPGELVPLIVEWINRD